MDISKKIGTLIFCGVPVIIGGGIVYGLSESYTAVGIFEALLITFAAGFVSR